MAFIKLYREKLKENYIFLDTIFSERKIQWAVVTKILCGNIIYLKEIIDLGAMEMHDSRISNLKKIKKTKCEYSNGLYQTTLKKEY